MAAIYTIFELNILGFQNFFSGLTDEPTNWPLVWDYDPNTPLMITVHIFKQLNLVLHDALSVRNTRTERSDSVRWHNREHINTTQELVVGVKGHFGSYPTTLVVKLQRYENLYWGIQSIDTDGSAAHVAQNQRAT